MKPDPALAAQRADRVDILDHAGLVVHVHDRDERRVRRDRPRRRRAATRPRGVAIDIGHRHPRSLERARVSSTDLCSIASDEIARAAARGRRAAAPCSARLFDLGGARREENSLGRRADARRDLLARALDQRRARVDRAGAPTMGSRTRALEAIRHRRPTTADRAAPWLRSRGRSRALTEVASFASGASRAERLSMPRRMRPRSGRRGALEDPPQLELHLPLMLGVQEARVGEQPLEMLAGNPSSSSAVASGASLAGPAGGGHSDDRHPQLVADHLHRHREIQRAVTRVRWGCSRAAGSAQDPRS